MNRQMVMVTYAVPNPGTNRVVIPDGNAMEQTQILGASWHMQMDCPAIFVLQPQMSRNSRTRLIKVFTELQVDDEGAMWKHLYIGTAISQDGLSVYLFDGGWE